MEVRSLSTIRQRLGTQPHDFLIQVLALSLSSCGLFSTFLMLLTCFLIYKIEMIIKAPYHRAFVGIKWDNLYKMYKQGFTMLAIIQFTSVAQSCLTLYNPMNCSSPSLPVHHQLLEFTQTHVHRVGDAIQQSHPLLPLSSPSLHLSQHQGLFQWLRRAIKQARQQQSPMCLIMSPCWCF